MAKKSSEIAKDSVTINGVEYEMLKADEGIDGCCMCDFDGECSRITEENDWTLCGLINHYGRNDKDISPYYFKRK